ncbi:SdrD B-like domain-containing protein [Staphylococcus delphini]|uniref:SdrD B-like domain-containing protein n=1 Tax=Staphylococcus delphini TaxID=53344 RepID=UPI0030B981B2
MFGAHTSDASAAEKTEETAVQSTPMTDTTETATKEAPVAEEATTNEPSVDEQAADTTSEKANTVDETEAASTKETGAVEEETMPAVDENGEATPDTTEAETDKVSTEAAEVETETSAPVTENVDTEKEVTPEKATTSSDNTPTTTTAPQMDQPEVGTLERVLSPSENIDQLETDEEKSKALADLYAENTGVSAEEAAEKVKAMNIDYSTADTQQLLAEMLVAFANEQDKNKVEATPLSLRSTSPVMRMAVAAEQPSGKLITKGNGITTISTTMTDKDKDDKGNGDGVIYPHNYGYIDIHTLFDVDDSVKAGDKFEIKYNKDLQVSDFFENRVTPPTVLNSGGEVIATGTYDLDSRTITYTFTDYVDKHDNVKVSLNLLAYVERDVVKNEGIHNFEAEVGGEKISKNLNVKYQVPFEQRNVNLNSFYDEYDNVTGEYSQTAYINPKGNYLVKPEVVIKGYGGKEGTLPESSSATILNTDKLEVYEVPAGVELAASYKPEFSKLNILQKDKDYTLKYENDKVTITFKQDGAKKYVIHTEGKQDMNSDQPLIQSVTLTATTQDNQYRSYAYSQNYIETQNSSAIGQGEKTYNLGNRVWEDVNNNDIQDKDDKGIANVTVKLIDAKTNQVIKSRTTDSQGYYLFDGLKNGEYIVEFVDPETNAEGKKYVPVTERVGNDREVDSDSRIVNVTIKDKDDLSIDRGFEVAPEPKPATYELGDYVWIDQNNDGMQNSDEVAVKGVKVTLTKPDGSTMTTTTDEKGKYLFTGLENGEYTVTFSDLPEGYVPTKTQAGGNTELDSNGLESKVTINNANNYSTDLGIVKPEPQPEPQPATYELGDYVWIDYNNDGIQNKGEAAVAGVKVTLTKPNGETLETVTDKDGKYLFTGLENGEYTVKFSELPEGYEPTKTQVGDDKLDSNGLESKVTIDNANNYSVDLGIVKPEPQPEPKPATYELGDYVWIDSNKDGIQNSNEIAVAGVKVTLTKQDGSTMTTTTDKDGKYLFTGLENGTYTVTFSELPEGYTPTETQVGDAQLDSNGLESKVTINNANDYSVDLGLVQPEEVEPPKVEATFNLGDKVWEDLNKDGIQNSNEPGIANVKVTLTKEDGSTVTATTDENGNYKFTELPNGKYTVTFETPEGYEPTTEKVGDYALDSDGQSVVVVINNKDDMTIDSGFHKPEEVEPPKVEATFNLGDKVWEDLNKDGIQNSNEPGIGGVTVTLTKEDGTTVTTTTDENGNYKFTELPNGEYTVTFETPKGYEATKTNVGDDALDSDGQTVKVIINNKDDMTIDSGFHKPTPEEPMKPTPEKPEQPNNPTPEVPEQPGQPENPTPEKPEQPNNPTPEVPEQPGQPGQPENPTPEKPEQPNNPTPEMPEQPGNPSPSMPNQPMNMGAHGEMSHDKAPKHEAKALPETGETSTNQAPLFGGLLAALGALFVVGRRKKQKDQ